MEIKWLPDSLVFRATEISFSSEIFSHPHSRMTFFPFQGATLQAYKTFQYTAQRMSKI